MAKYLISQIFFLFFLLIAANVAQSDVQDSQKPEVSYLIEFVETSDCAFERNGKMHDAKDAAKHIKRKYKHFRNKISTTEEFIEYSATKSTMSGKMYLIHCENADPVESRTWLLEELKNYRDNSST